jgi:cell wall-associated NlpC family hydrolase
MARRGVAERSQALVAGVTSVTRACRRWLFVLALCTVPAWADELPVAEAETAGDEDAATAVASPLSAPVQAGAEDIVMNAMGLIGTPYRRGGTSPARGFDCSGFIGHVFRQARGVLLPRSARGVYAMPEPSALPVARDALATGDLVFFRIGRLGRRIDHVGIYLGDGRMVHAPASGGEVRIDTLALPYWQRHYAGARRILLAGKPVSGEPGDDAGAAAAAAAADAPDSGWNESGGGSAATGDASETVARDLGDLPNLPPEEPH